MDQRKRKLWLHQALQPRDDIDKLHVSNKEDDTSALRIVLMHQ